MLDIDITLLYQVIGFFVLLFIMNGFLYKPMLKILKERDERINGNLKKAAETEKDVEDGLRAYDRRIKEAIIKGHEGRNVLIQEGVTEEKAALERARAKAAVDIGALRKEVEKSKVSAITSLRQEAAAISKEIAEKVLDRKFVVMLILCLLPLIPAIAGAAEEAGHGHEESIFNKELLWKTINFAILAVVVVVVWKKFIGKMLGARGEEIAKALTDAKNAKDAADAKHSEYATKLGMLDGRISELQKELELEGQLEKKRIIAWGEAASQRIMEQARFASAQELKIAKMELKKEAAELAVKMATEMINKEITPEDHARLVKGYVDKLRLN